MNMVLVVSCARSVRNLNGRRSLPSHTYSGASASLAHGIPITEVSRWLGHKF